MKELLDEKDRKILNILQTESMCTPKINEISKLVKLSPSSVHARIRKLERKGVIENYIARVDSKKAGKPLTIFSLIKLKYPETKEELKEMNKMPARIAGSSECIQEVYSLTGEWELLAKLKVKDMEEYYKIARECILPSAKVLKINGMVAVETLKETDFVDLS